MKAHAARFAVAVIVLRRLESSWEVLLVARKEDHSRWSLPGGKVDPGETSGEAAVRELHEETGLFVRVEDLLPQETILDSGGYFTTFYLLAKGEILSAIFEPSQGEAPVRWGSLEELYEGPFGRENRERFRKMGLIS